MAIVWSERLALLLRPSVREVEVLPFGYDDRWYSPTESPGGDRAGISFVGTWSPRRERFLRALEGLPLVVYGLGWEGACVQAGPPLTEAKAGEILRASLIGVNLLHPQNAGSHNMRTREIAASGALELTEPGTDGTPLRDGTSCRWFATPGDLRDQALWFLDHPEEAAGIAKRGQQLVASDTYVSRGQEIARLLRSVIRTARNRPGPE